MWRIHRRRTDNEDRRQKVQKARKQVYNNLYAIDNKTKVEVHLKPESLVLTVESLAPTYIRGLSLTHSQNAFSAALAEFGFNIFNCVPNDLMHEVESGTWRSTFIHLLRMLDCVGDNATQSLNWRYALSCY
jgi:hypothetical protein